MIIMPYGWSWLIAAAQRPSRLLAPHRLPAEWEQWPSTAQLEPSLPGLLGLISSAVADQARRTGVDWDVREGTHPSEGAH